jgi:hypothetical protein
MGKCYIAVVCCLVVFPCQAGTEGSQSTFYGQGAGALNTGGGNLGLSTFIGASAGAVNTSGLYNSFVGAYAGYSNTTGASNVFFGEVAGYNNTTGSSNTMIGTSAGISATTSSHNTFVGAEAGYNNSAAGNTFMGYQAGRANTVGISNTYLGNQAGSAMTGSYNTLIGDGAGSALNGATGHDNTLIGFLSGNETTTGSNNTFVGSGTGNNAVVTGAYNTFMGAASGNITGSGHHNTFLGAETGWSNTTGNSNTFVGESSGFVNTTGNRNVFIGFQSGYNESGSNKLYIDTCYDGGLCNSPLIYGEFDNHILKINGMTEVHYNGQNKSQLNFSVSSTDTGGFLTSVLDNNFFMSSGARYDGTAGGWTQRSSDQQSVIQGSGSLGYRVFTSAGHAVGTTFTPTTRLLIDYNGLFALNANATVAGHEIHTSSGAYLTSSGTWTNASSRDYKDEIKPLSAAAAAQTLAALEPVTFRYKNEADQQRVGFIAEDVPELVAMKDRKGLSPMDIVAVLTKVVQEQKQQLADQARELAHQTQHLARQGRELQAERSRGDSVQQQLLQLAAEIERLRGRGQ